MEADEQILNDAAQYIADAKVCVYMVSGRGSYHTETGVRFTLEEPFQMMFEHEANNLMIYNPARFRLATRDEVRQFYKNKSNNALESGLKRLQVV